MANDRNQNPASTSESSGRESQRQDGTSNQSQTDGNSGILGVNEGEDHDPDGTERPERRNDELEKDSDEYHQNQQEEIKPDVDGEDREDETERPTTAGGSSGSNDQTNGKSGSASN
jgi:hypothetical protein